MNYITTTEFEGYNQETDFSQYNDITISGMVSRASRWVDGYVGYSFDDESIISEKLEVHISSDYDLVIFTKKIPITAVNAIKLTLGTYNFALDLVSGSGVEKYDIPEPKSHILYPISQLSGAGSLYAKQYIEMRDRVVFTEVSYQAGYAIIPDDIKDAVNLITKDIFIRQVNPMQLKSTSQGGIKLEYGQSSLAKNATEILDRYKIRHL